MSDNPRRSDVAEKWGDSVATRGFAQIPTYLMQINLFLDKEHRLSPVELLVLMQLVGTWWRTNDKPFPSMGTLAIRCGVSERQIQRTVNQLEKVGFLRREKRRTKGIIASNAYSLAPLVGVLGEIAKHFPAAYPRKVNAEQAKAISAHLSGSRISETIPGEKADQEVALQSDG